MNFQYFKSLAENKKDQAEVGPTMKKRINSTNTDGDHRKYHTNRMADTFIENVRGSQQD